MEKLAVGKVGKILKERMIKINFMSSHSKAVETS